MPLILVRLKQLCLAMTAAALVGATGAATPCTACLEPFARSTPCEPPRGKLLILPGIRNTRFQLRGFERAAAELLPGFVTEIRRWGTPFAGLYNLRARERNRHTAAEIAAEIAAWRRVHPDDEFYLVGYSGGGGMATLIASELDDGVAIDRLVLIAPAIAPSFPIESHVLPHVREYLVNFSSAKDLQVGLGTEIFGTIDGEHVRSAGYLGLRAAGPQVIEWRWQRIDRALGHYGNHVAYLGRRWQTAYLLPALDPCRDGEQLEADWRAVRERLIRRP